MSLKYRIAFLMIVSLCSLVYTKNDQLGPADITIERVEECEEPERFPIPMPVKMKKLNRTHAGFSGCVNMPGPLDPSSVLNLTAAVWGDGGWKPNALNYAQADICGVLFNNTKKPWETIMKAAGRMDGSCPIPPGEYCIKDLALSLEGLFPSMLYGKFRVDTTFIYNAEPKSCIRAYIFSVKAK